MKTTSVLPAVCNFGLKKLADNDKSSETTLPAPRLKNRHSWQFPLLITVNLKEQTKSCEIKKETQTDERTNEQFHDQFADLHTATLQKNRRSYIIWKRQHPSPSYCVSEGLSLKRAITCICVSVTERALSILTTEGYLRNVSEARPTLAMQDSLSYPACVNNSFISIYWRRHEQTTAEQLTNATALEQARPGHRFWT